MLVVARARRFWQQASRYVAAFTAALAFHVTTAERPTKIPGFREFAAGVALLEAGEYEKAIQPLWRATQASHPEGLMRLRQAYMGMGQEWSMWHDLAKLHLRDIASGKVSNPAVTAETLRERVHVFYKKAIDTGAPKSVAKEYAEAQLMLGHDRAVLLSSSALGVRDKLQQLVGEIAETRGMDAMLWHELATVLFNARAWGKSLVAMSKALDLLPESAQIQAQVMYLRAKTMSWGGVDDGVFFEEINGLVKPSPRVSVSSAQSAKVANWSALWLQDLSKMLKCVSADLDRNEREVARGEPTRLPPLHPLMALFFPDPVTAEFRLRLASVQARALVAGAKSSTGLRRKTYKHAKISREWYRYKAGLADSSVRPRVKVGFLASRFHGSALALLLVGVMPALDKERLEVTMYSSTACDEVCEQDPWRQIFVNRVEHFVDLGGMDAAAAVERVRRDKNHVLVDMCGYNNEGNRFTEVLALRSAPVQMHVQDYMGSQGADFIDWLWADDVVLPPAFVTSGKHVSERVVYVQPSFFLSSHKELYDGKLQQEVPTSLKKEGPAHPWTRLQPEEVTCVGTHRMAMSKVERQLREEHQLPVAPLEDEVASDAALHLQMSTPYRPFVFACFNKMEKITPETLAMWMRILVLTRHLHGGSILWLLKFPAEAEDGLRWAARAEIHRELLRDPDLRNDSERASQISHALVRDRIVFGEFYPTDAENMARLVLADLVLDTQPYGAHTGAVDALWSGVPIVTRTDVDAMAARVALSLLAGLAEPRASAKNGTPDLLSDLAAGSSAEYEAIAVAHARNRTLHAHVRSKLMLRRRNSRIFDASEHAASLASAVLAVWGEYLEAGAQSPSKRQRMLYAYGKEAEKRSAILMETASTSSSRVSAARGFELKKSEL